MDTKSLTYKTLKNISYSVVGYVWVLVFSIVVTPLIVFKLGVETYGVYILVLTVSSLMGLFDLGIHRILVKYVSEYAAIGEEKKLKDLMYSFNLILLGNSFFSLIVLILIGYWANVFFPSQTISGEYYFTLFLLSGLISFVGGMDTLFVVVPTALQRLDISTKIGLVNLTLSNVTILLLLYSGYGIKAIFLSQLFYSVLFLLVSRHYAKKILPLADLKFAWKWAEVKNAYKFGVATYLSNAANSALTYFDRLLIPIFYGPAALSYYSVPGNVAAKTPTVVDTLSGIIFPMTSSLYGLKDMEKIKYIYKRVFNLITVVSFSITLSIVLFANKILRYWLNEDFAARSTTVLIILAFTYFLLSLGGTLNNFLLGLSKSKFIFLASLSMVVINVGLLFLLLPRFGIEGAAWAYLISVLPIIFMFYYTEKKFLGLSGRFFDYFKLYIKLTFVSIIFVILCKLAILPLVNSLKDVIIFGPLSVLLFLLIYRVFRFFAEEDLKAINGFMLIVISKFRFAK